MGVVETASLFGAWDLVTISCSVGRIGVSRGLRMFGVGVSVNEGEVKESPSSNSMALLRLMLSLRACSYAPSDGEELEETVLEDVAVVGKVEAFGKDTD